MISGWTVLVALMWMLAGAAIALAAMFIYGLRLERGGWFRVRGINPHAAKLGRECEVDFGGQWRRYTVVAVSWKGALAVRPVDGSRTRWVPKDDVDARVRWEIGGDAE